MFPGQCGNTAFFFKSQPDQFHFEFRGIVFPGKSFFSAHEVSTCKISGCLSYRILDSGPDGTQTTLTIKGFTQKDVSERLGVTQQTYARLEANPASASIDRLYKVFSILGVEITLSSISPSPFISHTEMRGAFDSTPARREKW